MSTRALTPQEIARLREILENLLKRHGTQASLARAVDISQQVISRILSGDGAGLHVARHVATFLKVSVEQMLTMPPNLATLIHDHPKRWGPWTIAAVLPMGVGELSAEELRAFLDLTNERLLPLVAVVKPPLV